ncbi:hypothetical protein FEM33_02765 [Dyadobacter flavalbus]|uniref:DUF642 domain-containing protein n=1 Tax=Dyadobacter flavalbus TaxID=2579942 RepID=A0A5M8R0S9_9BACT|nr:hypothetical protein [Dyadobacter flavalbus]KAA6441248.1 hypothetical protein FEM33_02765 [Dyadobacter flavalbus]
MASAACLSTMLFMSSCSNEDAVAPSPAATVTNDGSNLKTNLIGSGYGISPNIFSTNVTAGFHVYPTNWVWHPVDSGPATISLEEQKKRAPMGVSTLDYVWGNPSLPWIKKLGPTSSPGNILTITTQKGFEKGYTAASATTKIRHLIPGKKYSITFQVATTIRNTPQGITQYAPGVSFNLSNVQNGNDGYIENTSIDLTGKPAEWVTKTVIFQADKEEVNAEFTFSFYSDYVENNNKFYHYAHIFVGENAVKEIN